MSRSSKSSYEESTTDDEQFEESPVQSDEEKEEQEGEAVPEESTQDQPKANKSGSIKGVTSAEYKREYYLKNRERILKMIKARQAATKEARQKTIFDKKRLEIIDRLNNKTYKRRPPTERLLKYNIVFDESIKKYR